MAKKTTTKGCKTCKKKPTIKELEVPVEEYIVTPEDLMRTWGLLNETKLLREETNFKFVSGIYKEVTGRTLDLSNCVSCKIAKVKRIFQNNVRITFNISL